MPKVLKRYLRHLLRKPRKSDAVVSTILASGLFDEAWYLKQYPDVGAAGRNPVRHYVRYGAAEGRDPGPAFDTLWYLETNPDVAQAGINPLYHYARFGRREGRTPRPSEGSLGALHDVHDTGKSIAVNSALLLCDASVREAVREMFAGFDPAIAEILEINADAWSRIAERRREALEPLTVIVTHNEVSHDHGTGVLIKRIFGNVPSVLTVRAWSSFGNRDEIGFANIWLGNKSLSDQQLYRLFSFLLAGQSVRCVVAVPYNDMDLRMALRISEILSAPFVPYIMDDNNVVGRRITDTTMSSAVKSAAVRFVISTEMRQAYEGKFQKKFFILPPLVPSHMIGCDRTARLNGQERGLIVGNIWRQNWLDELLKLLETSGVELDWICNSNDPHWLTFDRADIAGKGLHFVGPLPEDQLVERLRQSPFCLLPTLAGDDDPSSTALARLSLPSRVVLIVAASQIPIIVVGDDNTAAARFVRRFGVGLSVPHESEALKDAIDTVLDPVFRSGMRANAANIAQLFSSDGIADWFFESLRAGQAIDDRFEAFLSTPPGELAIHIDNPCPSVVDPGRRDAFRALRRLSGRGFRPDFVVDAGASNGIWSHSMSLLFPETRFLLVEPLLARYTARRNSRLIDGHPNFEVAELALLDRDGEIEIQVSGDLFNSSAMGVRLTGIDDVIKVPAVTLDRLARERNLAGRGLLKIDVQFAEHLVLDGGQHLLQNQIDVVIVEMTLRREHPDALTFLELCNKLHDLGFDFEDDAGEWRSPIDGRLEQKDGLFVRRGSFLA